MPHPIDHATDQPHDAPAPPPRSAEPSAAEHHPWNNIFDRRLDAEAFQYLDARSVGVAVEGCAAHLAQRITGYRADGSQVVSEDDPTVARYGVRRHAIVRDSIVGLVRAVLMAVAAEDQRIRAAERSAEVAAEDRVRRLEVAVARLADDVDRLRGASPPARSPQGLVERLIGWGADRLVGVGRGYEVHVHERTLRPGDLEEMIGRAVRSALESSAAQEAAQ